MSLALLEHNRLEIQEREKEQQQLIQKLLLQQRSQSADKRPKRRELRKAFFEQTTPTNLRSSTDGRLAFHTIMEVQNESNTRKPQNVRIKKKKPSIPLALKAKKKPTVSTSFSQSGFNSDIPTTISNIKPTGAAIFDSSF